MASIHLDDFTAKLIEEQARLRGLTVAEYVQSLLPITVPDSVRPAWDDIERELAALSSNEGSLPDNFSRADIYSDHD